MAFRGTALLFIGLLVGAEYVSAAQQADQTWILGKHNRKVKLPPTGSMKSWGLELGSSPHWKSLAMVTRGGQTDLEAGDLVLEIDKKGSKPSVNGTIVDAIQPGAIVTVMSSDQRSQETLEELHKTRCKGKCSGKAKDNSCVLRKLKLDTQANMCRMADGTMLEENTEKFLDLHLGAAVYKAKKFDANCKGRFFKSSWKCERRLQQMTHAMLFIAKAKDALGQPLNEDRKEKFMYVQKVLSGEDFALVERLQAPTPEMLEHPNIALNNIIMSMLALKQPGMADEARAHILEHGASPMEEQIEEEAEVVQSWRSMRGEEAENAAATVAVDMETTMLETVDEGFHAAGHAALLEDGEELEEPDAVESDLAALVEVEKPENEKYKIHYGFRNLLAKGFYRMSWVGVTTTFITAVIFAIAGYLMFYGFPIVVFSMISWAVFSLMACGLLNRRLGGLVRVGRSDEEKEKVKEAKASQRQRKERAKAAKKRGSFIESESEVAESSVRRSTVRRASESVEVTNEVASTEVAGRESWLKSYLKCAVKTIMWPMILIGDVLFLPVTVLEMVFTTPYYVVKGINTLIWGRRRSNTMKKQQRDIETYVDDDIEFVDDDDGAVYA